MGRVRLFPYKDNSRSTKLLAQTLEAKRIRRTGSRFVPRNGDVIINWGSSSCPDYEPARVLNRRESIINAANKLTAFLLFAEGGVETPPFFTNYDSIPREDESRRFVARGSLTGHSGAGITIGTRDEIRRDVHLYTAYIPKEQEYRVHVVGSSVVFVQRKARRRDCDNPNWDVRNLAGGFVFVAAESPPEGTGELSVRAVRALGLDFGAVDVILGRDGKLYVLEVNTACGLEQRTADKYAAALKEIINA